jgi:hypothetical protein
MAKQDDERYQKEMHHFITHLNNLRTATTGAALQEDSVHSSSEGLYHNDGPSTANLTPVKPSSHVLMRKPKKPLSAYIFYSQEQRDRLKRANPHLSTRDVML